MSREIRTFIAIELPDPVIDDIQNLQSKIRKHGFPVRWVQPKNIHLTVKFLGNIQQTDIETIGEALAVAIKTQEAFTLTPRNIGVFPSIRKPRVVWVGIGESVAGKLRLLQSSLDDALAGFGFEKEKRPFKGHLTIGRVKKQMDNRKFLDVIEPYRVFNTGSFIVTHVVMFQSVLQPDGPVYTKLMKIPLGS